VDVLVEMVRVSLSAEVLSPALLVQRHGSTAFQVWSLILCLSTTRVDVRLSSSLLLAALPHELKNADRTLAFGVVDERNHLRYIVGWLTLCQEIDSRKLSMTRCLYAATDGWI
jgi:hypothetical protein